MGGSASFTASPFTRVFGSEGGGSGTEGWGRPTNLSTPSGERRSVGRTSAGTDGLLDLGAGRGAAAGTCDSRTCPLAPSGSVAAPGALGESPAVFAAGLAPKGAGSTLRPFSSLTRLLAGHHTFPSGDDHGSRDRHGTTSCTPGSIGEVRWRKTGDARTTSHASLVRPGRSGQCETGSRRSFPGGG